MSAPLNAGPVRVRTVVFGLLLALVAITVVVTEATDLRVDGVGLAIAAVIGAGVLLLGGAVLAVMRERRPG